MSRRPSPAPFQSPKLGGLRRWALYVLVAALLASGAVWLWVHLRTPQGAMPSALEPWMMKLHGAAALLIIYLAGTMLYGHMLNAWHQRRNRLTGSVTATAFVMLGLSGYGLYYFGGEGLRMFTEWLHWAFGFGAPALLWVHVWRGRRRVSLVPTGKPSVR
jgi:hypothetical protein